MVVPLLAYLAKRGLFKWFTESGVGESLISKYTGNQLTGAEREANQFTAEQAELSRQFQEDMYVKYQSPAAMMEQYKDAGLNPALMYGGAGSPSGSFSSSGASSVSPASGASILDSIVSMMMASSQMRLARSQEKVNLAQAQNLGAQTARTERLTEAEYENLLSQVRGHDAQSALAFANVGLLSIDAKTREEYNRVQIKVAEMNNAKSSAEIERLRAETNNLKREYVISFAREAAIKANTSLMSKQELNALMEHNILYWNSEKAEYEASIAAFENDKKEVNRVFNLVGQGAGILRDLGIGVGAVVAGAGRAVGSAAGSFVRESSYNAPFYLNGN